jgi:sulfur carrier protein
MNAPGRRIKVRINDEPRDLPEGSVLSSLLAELGLAKRPGLAVAINAEVAPRANWDGLRLGDGDDILIIKASQGG